MHLISAIIQPFQLENVTNGLHALGVSGMTVSEVNGFGRQMGQPGMYRGNEYHVEFISKTKIEIAVEDDQVERAVETIREHAASGTIGDGKVFIKRLAQSITIRDDDMDVDGD